MEKEFLSSKMGLFIKEILLMIRVMILMVYTVLKPCVMREASKIMYFMDRGFKK